MRRADRLFQIIQYLRKRNLTTARWLAERLEVSDRTIYRDIQDLMCSGVPIDGEAGMGYILRGEFEIPPLMFNREEIEALTVGARMIRAWGGGKLSFSAQQALDKIESVLPQELRKELDSSRIFVPAFHNDRAPKLYMDEVHLAINQRKIIRINYTRKDGEQSERELFPLGLFFWGHVWTLAAWCLLREEYRSFRVDRIQALEILNQIFHENETVSLNAFFEHIETSYG
ncbi:MAG: YafY family transcriptional regulator [Gammaproteobacteria bacterium]|nr:YafY family transcriptional regulator [Gammaproteobacteria bacterium]